MTLCRGQIVGDKKKKVCFPLSIMKNMENGKITSKCKKNKVGSKIVCSNDHQEYFPFCVYNCVGIFFLHLIFIHLIDIKEQLLIGVYFFYAVFTFWMVRFIIFFIETFLYFVLLTQQELIAIKIFCFFVINHWILVNNWSQGNFNFC